MQNDGLTVVSMCFRDGWVIYALNRDTEFTTKAGAERGCPVVG
jgi:hypothetical protein